MQHCHLVKTKHVGTVGIALEFLHLGLIFFFTNLSVPISNVCASYNTTYILKYVNTCLLSMLIPDGIAIKGLF